MLSPAPKLFLLHPQKIDAVSGENSLFYLDNDGKESSINIITFQMSPSFFFVSWLSFLSTLHKVSLSCWNEHEYMIVQKDASMTGLTLRHSAWWGLRKWQTLAVEGESCRSIPAGGRRETSCVSAIWKRNLNPSVHRVSSMFVWQWCPERKEKRESPLPLSDTFIFSLPTVSISAHFSLTLRLSVSSAPISPCPHWLPLFFLPSFADWTWDLNSRGWREHTTSTEERGRELGNKDLQLGSAEKVGDEEKTRSRKNSEEDNNGRWIEEKGRSKW